MKKLWFAALLFASPMVFAQSLSCQIFDFQSKQVQQERNTILAKYEHRNIDTLSEQEAQEWNRASLLSEKMVCTFSGSLKQAFAVFRADKRYGLGQYSPKFPRELPRKKYNQMFDYKKITQDLMIIPQGNQVEMTLGLVEDESAWSYHFILRQEGKQVRIERRQLSS